MRERVLRVVQLNLGSLLEPDWPSRRYEVVSWLDHLAPDVVCCQEVWEGDGRENTAAWVARHAAGEWDHVFGGAPLHEAMAPDPSVRFGSSVLSRWEIETSELHLLPVLEDPSDPFPSMVPWELLHARTAGLDVFSTHLAAAPSHGHHRRAQVLAIDEHVRRIRGDLDQITPAAPRRAAMPPVLCGDFNAEPDSDEIRFLSSLATIDGRTAFWQDAWRVAGDGPGLTQDWRTNPIAESLNVHRKRIDYVFVGDPFLRQGNAGRVLSARVAFDEPRTGVLASDHFGLVVDVVWPSRPD